MRKITVLLCLAVLIVLAGCGGSSSSSAPEKDYTSFDPLNVIGQGIIGMEADKAGTLLHVEKDQNGDNEAIIYSSKTTYMGHPAMAVFFQDDGVISQALYSVSTNRDNQELNREEAQNLIGAIYKEINEKLGVKEAEPFDETAIWELGENYLILSYFEYEQQDDTASVSFTIK